MDRHAKVVQPDRVIFLDGVVDTDINGEWFSITLDDETEYLYPSRRTDYIVISSAPEDQEPGDG